MADGMGLTGTHAEAVADYGKAAAGYAHSGEGTPMDRMHAATGLQEEAIELFSEVESIWNRGGVADGPARNRLKSEMGGVLWYVNYTAHVYGHTLSDVAAAYHGVELPMVGGEGATYQESTTRAHAGGLLRAARHVASQIKKNAYHGKAMPDTAELLRSLYVVWAYVALLGLPYGVNVRHAMAYNLTELQARHGGTTFDPTVYTEGRK